MAGTVKVSTLTDPVDTSSEMRLPICPNTSRITMGIPISCNRPVTASTLSRPRSPKFPCGDLMAPPTTVACSRSRRAPCLTISSTSMGTPVSA